MEVGSICSRRGGRRWSTRISHRKSSYPINQTIQRLRIPLVPITVSPLPQAVVSYVVPRVIIRFKVLINHLQNLLLLIIFISNLPLPFRNLTPSNLRRTLPPQTLLLRRLPRPSLQRCLLQKQLLQLIHRIKITLIRLWSENGRTLFFAD